MAGITAGRLVGRISRKLPNNVVRMLKGSPFSRLVSRWASKPTLSVIVPVYNVQEYLTECLESVLNQTLRRMEIIVVDDGSTDSSPEILRSFAARDRRIRIIRQPNAGLGAARNAGIALAQAPFITFLDSDDTIPAAAYDKMVRTLRRTGSDFAVGGIRRVKNGKVSRPAWVANVHDHDQLRISIDDFPDAMQDVVACNRMFRREFWNESVGPFPEDIAYEDHAPMVTAYVRAAAFDLLAFTTYNWRIREDETSIGQQKHETQNLKDRITVKEMAWKVISDEASPEVKTAWLGRVLDIDLPIFVEYAINHGADYRSVLQEAISRFIERADESVWPHVRVGSKLRIAVAAQGEWRQADRIIEYFRLNGATPATTVAGGRVMAQLPFQEELPVPDSMFELSKHQTTLSACLSKAVWQPDGQLWVEGWAFIRGIDLTNDVPAISAELVDAKTGKQLPLMVVPFTSSAITRWANHPNQRYDHAGFRLTIDPSLLAEDGGYRSRRWQLRVRTEIYGIAREGSVPSIVRQGLGLRMKARDLVNAEDPFRIVPLMDEALGFVIQVRRESLRAESLTVDGARASGAIRGLLQLSFLPHSVVARHGKREKVKAAVNKRPDGSFTFTLDLPTEDDDERTWAFRLLDDRGVEHRVSWPTERDYGHEVGGYGSGSALWRRSPRGFVELSSNVIELRATSVTIDDQITVEVAVHGVHARHLQRAALHSRAAAVTVSQLEPLGDGRFRLIFPSMAAKWGLPERPLPTGTYSIRVAIDDTRTVQCKVDDGLLEQLPIKSLCATHESTVARVPGNEFLTIYLGPPLKDDERGRVSQRRLAAWYDEREFKPRDAVMFQCYRGEFATDSQLAIHQELHQRSAPLQLIWGVSDLSVDLPDGATPVVIGSREWYQAIGSSRYLCNNIDFDRFFRRRPYQKFLQTFHGYPFKSMGISFWRAKNISEDVISYECERRNAAWTSIVVPSDFCEEMYRREYRYENEVLVTGYPRDDVLVTADHSRVRRDVLERLGVPLDKTVILYAPTWRDTVATGAWSAKFFDELDLGYLTGALGDDYVILLRGHNYNLREGTIRSAHAAVIDVTRYPEINDLTMAADVALLDYSSLRFDWALTHKPILFFVPDLDSYLGSRTALFDYGPTAPGPLLSTTEEVAQALHHLDVVSERFAPDRAEFNDRFNALHDGKATSRVVDAFFGSDAGA